MSKQSKLTVPSNLVWKCDCMPKSYNLATLETCRTCGKTRHGTGIQASGRDNTETVSVHGSDTKTPKKANSRKCALDLLNKVEWRLYQWLRSVAIREDQILIQPTLVFPDGDRYRPDLAVVGGAFTCYECKGSYSLRFSWAEQGVERFKRARATWPAIRFVMLQEVKGKKGEFREVNHE